MQNGNTRRRKIKGTEKIIEVIIVGNFPKLMTDPKQEI